MELRYVKSGDYYIPDLALAEGDSSIGKYGRLHRQYLKDYRPVLFTTLLLSGELYPHLTEINRACVEQMNLLTRQMAAQEGVTEPLKASDQMEWVARMNSIRNRAEEIVLDEFINC